MTDGLEFIEVRTRLFPQEPTFIGMLGFPPTDPMYSSSRSLEEQGEVPAPKTFNAAGEPDEGMQLVIGVRAPRPGVARSRGVEVTYRVGERQYREVYQHEIYLCVPAEAFGGDDCPGSRHREQFDDRSANPIR